MSTQGTPEALEAQLAKMREELTGTVNELTDRFTVKNLSATAKGQAKEKLGEAKEQAEQLLGEAASGDKRAIAILGGVALGVVFVVGRLLRH